MDCKDLSVFSAGEKNDAFAQYFTGQSYLNMISTQQVPIGNVTFEPAVTTGIFIMQNQAADKYLL